MNMQAATPTLVTVARAAQLLTAAGDKITAPNVSRYLDRHPEIHSEKRGRERLVDIVALAALRKDSVFVADKQAQRGIEGAPLLASAQPVLEMPPEDGGDQTLAEINRSLKQLELRKKTREEDLASGKLVPDSEVLTLISTVIRTVTASLERQEAGIAQQFGREVATAFRRTRKAAMAEASGRLAELAQRHLPPTLAGAAVEAGATTAEPQA